MKILIVILLLFCFACSSVTQSQVTVNIISAENIRQHTEILAHDSLEGRGTGQIGGEKAVRYISTHFKNIGLTPTGDRNTFFQYIPMHGSIPLPTSELKIYLEDEVHDLTLNKDFLLYKTGQQTFIPSPLPIVFAGYGIHAPEYDYNDYHSINPEGKIVVFLEGEPFSDNPKYFVGSIPSIYSLPESKQRLAFAKGAAGSILLPGEIYKDTLNWQNLQQEFSFEDVVLAYSVSNNFSININPNSAEMLFKESGYNINDVYEMHRTGKMKSFELKTSLSFKGVFKQRDFLSPNIIGMVKGTDTKLQDSYVLVSAHYDHLGIGPEFDGDSIYNGALDNAIGTAVMMEIAAAITKSNIRLKRSIIFIATTGEEKGLLGSAYYVENPVVPLYKTVANINIDGIALFRDFTSMVGVGSEYSSLKKFLIETLNRFNLKLTDIPDQFYQFEAFSKSDQIMFATAGLPSILVLEGPDNKHISREEVLKEIIDYDIYFYHTPFDDLKLLEIDYKAAGQHAEVLKDLIISIANSDKEPEWNKGAPYINARLRSIAERK